VRIGLHTSEASAPDRDYLGEGVHLAARIGAAAAGGEVLISAESVVPGIPHRLQPVRTVVLKGIPQPVKVRAVGWSAT
jgi:class 3 adenylate cyclase